MVLNSEQKRAFHKFCEILFARSNLIGTDFKDIVINRIESKFEQDRAGLRIEFSVSNHAIGKRLDKEMTEAYEVMFPKKNQNNSNFTS